MKKEIISVLAILMTLSCFVTAHAGQWKQDYHGWWYQNDNGSCPRNAWQQINGKWYCFDGAGYMLHDTWAGNYYLGSDGAMLTNTTTPDGYRVGPDGHYVQEIVKTRIYEYFATYIDDESHAYKYRPSNDRWRETSLNRLTVLGDGNTLYVSELNTTFYLESKYGSKLYYCAPSYNEDGSRSVADSVLKIDPEAGICSYSSDEFSLAEDCFKLKK